MIRLLFCGLTATCVLLYICTSAGAQTSTPTLTFGNVNVQQNDNLNNGTSVTLSLDYSHGTISIRPNGSNRGDFGINFSSTPTQDHAKGILITTASENGRDNSAGGDSPATRYSTTANYGTTTWSVSMINTGGGEWNSNFAAAWFPYEEGWIGGHAIASGGKLTTFTGSAGIAISSTATGSNVIYDRPDTGLPEGETATPGVYELNLTGINSMTDGILLTVGGDNSDNYSMSRANADGSWTVMVVDNGTNGNSGEAGSFGFVYVPKTSVVSSPDQAGIHAMGRVNGNMTRDVTAGNYVIVRSGLGEYKLYAPGIDPETATLLLGMELGTGDNILTYGGIDHGWVIANRDLPSAGLQDAGSGDLLSFTIMTSGNTASVWDAGGGTNRNWSTTTNWIGDANPLTGRDVIIGTGGAVNIDSAQTAGMVFINSDTAFNITGTAPLTINTGLVVNSAPTAAQVYTVSAPIILGDDAFVIAQSMGAGVTLRFNVASGNAITSDGFDLTLSGGGTIELQDSISLGTGKLIKEGDGQVNLSAANTLGGTVITSGYTGTGNAAAFRFVAAGAWGAFSTSDIEFRVERGGDVTTSVLYFDSGGGSGALSNNIIIQSTVTNANIRIHLDSGVGLDARLAGLISGGNNSSIFVVSSDAANGQGKLHLTNTSNTFIAEAIQINGGGLFVYGDGSLGAAENDINLNTNNTNSNTGSGLHFGADNIVLNAARSITMTSNSVIHTEGYNATIEGVISGTGTLIKEGEGILTLSGANTLTGKVRVNAGMIAISSEENLGAVPAAATPDQLVLNGGGLQALADLVINDANRGILLEAGGGIDTNGHHVRVETAVTGSGSFLKLGDGTLEFAGANTYTGSTVVQQGTLVVSNPAAPEGTPIIGAVTVYNGGTFGGKGTVGGPVMAEGNIAPGIAPGDTGTLVFSQGLELYPSARVQLEIASQTEYDKIEVTGAPLGVDTSTVFEVILTNGPDWGWEFDLVDWVSLSADSDLSDNFVLPDISASGWYWNTDNLSEGKLQIVPEPSRALLLLGGMLVCLLRRRR